MDKDLQFLVEMPNEELGIFIKILTQDNDGEGRWNEGLTSLQAYKNDPSNPQAYIREAIYEFQKYGGDTIANMVRGGKGVSYSEILDDVCKSLKIHTDKNADLLSKECSLLEKYFRDELEKLSNEDVEKLAREFGINSSQTKDEIINKILELVFVHGSKIFFKNTGFGAGIGAGVIVGQLASRFFGSAVGGPIGWSISLAAVISTLSGPATRVTIPATLYIAYLRQVYIQRKEEEKMNEEIGQLEAILKDAQIPEPIRVKMIKGFDFKNLMKQKLNVLFVGGTGVGKSSTINALFEEKKAEVGLGLTPETMDIKEYNFGNFVVYDSPGLGDSPEKDKEHIQKITKLLQEKNEENEALIDLVLIIIDGRTRDLGTLGELIKAIKPSLNDHRRILVAMNKCDQAGKDPTMAQFDYSSNQPNEDLLKDLEEGAEEIRSRVEEYGVETNVVYYSSGLTKRDGTRQQPYNLSKLLHYIIKNTPQKKRFIYIQHRSKNENNFQSNDESSYNEENRMEAGESLWVNFKEWVKKLGERVVDEVVPRAIDVIVKYAEKKMKKW